MKILKLKPTDEEVKRYAVSYMEGRGSFEYCRNVLEVLNKRAKALVEEVDQQGTGEKGGSEGVLKILEKMIV
jgi:geranylgeranyl diphosphate synthase type 3